MKPPITLLQARCGHSQTAAEVFRRQAQHLVNERDQTIGLDPALRYENAFDD